MIRTLVCMLVLMVILLFPGLPIINSLVDDILASPEVSGTSLEIVVRLIQIVYIAGSVIGIPALAVYMIRNR